MDIHYFGHVANCVPNEGSVASAGLANAYPTNVFQRKDAMVTQMSVPSFDYCGRVTNGNVRGLVPIVAIVC